METTNNKTINKKNSLGNASKFGMAGIGIALLLLGFAFTEVITLNILVLATVLTMGVAAPLIAGILEFTRGESFRSTSFLLSSLFFLAFYISTTRVLGTAAPDKYTNGIFFSAWAIVNIFFICGTMFRTMDYKMIMLQIVLGLFTAFTILLAIAQFTQVRGLFITAGAFAIACAAAILVDYAIHTCMRKSKAVEK